MEHYEVIIIGGGFYGCAIALYLKERFSISKILILPLYPQAGSPTTTSTFDAINAHIKDQSWVPNIRFVAGYHDNKDYIECLSKSIENSFSKHGKPDKLIFSYHGMPERYCGRLILTRNANQCLT